MLGYAETTGSTAVPSGSSAHGWAKLRCPGDFSKPAATATCNALWRWSEGARWFERYEGRALTDPERSTVIGAINGALDARRNPRARPDRVLTGAVGDPTSAGHAPSGRPARVAVIIIDTNVISEMMRDEPHPEVLAWTATAGRLHTTAIALAEVGYGIARLPGGRRRDQLTATAAGVFADFDEVIVPFDARAARRYGGIVAGREELGRPIATADAQIAAICVSREASLATRNTAAFDATGVSVINPWEGPSR